MNFQCKMAVKVTKDQICDGTIKKKTNVKECNLCGKFQMTHFSHHAAVLINVTVDCNDGELSQVAVFMAQQQY